MSEEESIIATRSRRANAGSRLKHLLELEELQNETLSSTPLNDDDENVNLLFQEDDDDGEFVESDSDNEQEESEEDEEIEQGEPIRDDSEQIQSELSDEDEDEDGSTKKRSYDEDEMLSDSDLSVSETDEEEGEKELQKQEKTKKRATSKRQKLVNPKITTRPKEVVKKSKSRIKADSLLEAHRRSSSRKTTVENKLAVVERLKESEERRAKLKPVIRKETIELTQDERMAEAVETEKKNVLSLIQFHENEVMKKEKQRALQGRKKQLTHVLRFDSKDTLIYPIDEINQAIRVIEMGLRRKDRRGRKKKVVVEQAVPGAPVIMQTMNEDKKEIPEKKEEATTIDEKSTVSVEPVKQENETVDSEKKIAGDTKQDNETVDSEKTIDGATDVAKPEKPETESEDVIMKESTEEDAQIENKKEIELNKDEVELVNDEESVVMKDKGTKQETTEQETEEADKAEKEQDVPPIKTEESDIEIIESSETTKKVKFDLDEESAIKPETDVKEEVDETSMDKKEESVDLEDATPTPEVDLGPIYEGPPQRVAQNNLSFLQFPEGVTIDKIKIHLFGKDALLPPTRRFKDLEPIARIRQPPAVQDDLFHSFKEIKSRQFDQLKSLPRFGDIRLTVETDQFDEVEEEVVAQIKTPAPMGIYLPNGNKKTCFITGKQALYFHPERGIPYSSVEAFRVIETIEQGEYVWTNFENGGGCFIGLRNGQRHAKGVPEGFDAFS